MEIFGWLVLVLIMLVSSFLLCAGVYGTLLLSGKLSKTGIAIGAGLAYIWYQLIINAPFSVVVG